jgi:hypothetical protein
MKQDTETRAHTPARTHGGTNENTHTHTHACEKKKLTSDPEDSFFGNQFAGLYHTLYIKYQILCIDYIFYILHIMNYMTNIVLNRLYIHMYTHTCNGFPKTESSGSVRRKPLNGSSFCIA